MKLISIVIILLTAQIFAQNNFILSGRISDKSTGKHLPFANLKIIEKPIGTSANSEGDYRIKLQEENYVLIYSYIGYKSDTLQINLTSDKNLDVSLTPRELAINEVTVTPGINPAIAIIKKTIKQKQEREKLFDSYQFEAYTKGVVRSDKEVEASTGQLDVSLFDSKESDDSTKLAIVGILENQSKGFFKKPDLYKDEIIARRQTANFPSSLNVITGGRLIQSFYDENLNITGVDLPSPISDDALDYYYYYIEDSLAYDNQKVFRIYFAPDNSNDPGFIGKIYITEKFDLVKVEAEINSAANPGGIFKEMKLFQQFLRFDNIYLPVDYRIFGEIDFLGIIRMSFEFNSTLNEYKINKSYNNQFFDMALVKVNEGADDKDSIYWNSIQTFPMTDEETSTFFKMDSLMNVPYNFWDQFSPFSFNYNLGKNYTITAPLGMYNFNKIEGHSLNVSFSARELMNKRLWTNSSIQYGFADEKLKGEIGFTYLFGQLRNTRLNFNAYSKLKDLFGESINYSNFSSTVLSLFSKQDFRDYYYSKGFDISFSTDFGKYLNLGIGFLNRTDNSAKNNSDFSFFYKDRTYSQNEKIYNTRINAVRFSFDFDFRKHIEDGFFKRRVSQGKSTIFFSGDLLFSRKWLASEMDFTTYNFRIFSNVNGFGNTNLNIRFDASFSSGAVPYQMLKAVPGVIDNVAKSSSFRSLRVGEAVGDKMLMLRLNYFFQDELFRIFNLNFLQSLELTLAAHFRMVYLDISDESRMIWYNGFDTYKTPLMEAGFSVGQKIIPISLDLTWRLNHRSENKFNIGISTPLF